MSLGPPLQCLCNQELCTDNFKSSRQKKEKLFFNIFYENLARRRKKFDST